MKIAILGSGGREHSIAYSISKSKKIKKIYCIPGNAGTEEIAENINIDINNFEKIRDFLKEKEVELVMVGPEDPLVNGVVDYLENFNIKVFGPNKKASQLEGSKIFTKNLCKKYKIPTANFGVFTNIKDSIDFINNAKHPIVIKADNLAAGKGVYICENIEQSSKAVEEIFNGKFGKAKNLLIEEFLRGEEMSYFIVSDGSTIKNFGTAQDHKRVNEGDKGQNTGGMGAYSPSRLINKNLENKIINKIINPTLKGLKDMGIEYKGFLYAGLMIKNEEPYLIEYNVRMGDPECQTILPKLETDLMEVLLSCCERKLNEIDIQWNEKKSLSIVLCSKGYPNEYKKNLNIKNIEKIITDQNNFCFHAGTILKNNEIFAVGGRVLNFISMANSFSKARQDIIKNINILNWESGFYRKDIGYKVIDE